MNGTVVAIFVSPVAGGPMQKVQEVAAIIGAGLKGDRYATGEGSFNRGSRGKRQVTLIGDIFFIGSGFEYRDSRRNIVTHGVELMWLIGREFQIGDARMRGIKYCDPCERPTKLSGNVRSFRQTFFDRGGLVAEIIVGGIIKTSDPIIPPLKGY
jgi:hypothetical protein